MNPTELAILGGVVIVTGALKDVAVRLIMQGLGNKNGNNGYCKDHHTMSSDVAWLKDQHEEEKRINVIIKAMKRANGVCLDARD